MLHNLILIALFSPLLSSIVSALFIRSPKKLGIFSSILIGISFISSFLLFVFYENSFSYSLFDWLNVGNFKLSFGVLIDPISLVMINTVTLVALIVHVYSIFYMDEDKSINRYFSYLGLFVFAMMILVMSDNFLGLFFGWEGVGLCSWLLIGFWFENNDNTKAANEAFIINRIADLGMLMGLFYIYWNTGSLQYSEVFAQIPNLSNTTITLIAMFLFIGAMGKSAQFPLHTWLAKAMAGPTPVSALIHAATMVTAGVYLLVRSNEIFALAPSVNIVITYLGVFVALFAASMAMVSNDLKKIIAYSTLSQLGYMFVACGVGAYWVALFHLFTHAFFKSVLFLGAGNIMHACKNELNIKKMGGLYKDLKVTAIIMIIASASLSGLPFLSGFFSKDKILESAFSTGYLDIWILLLLGAMMTTFYSFRLILLVFFVPSKEKNSHTHDAPKYVLYAMGILGVLSISAGWIINSFEKFINIPFELNIEHSTHYVMILITVLAVIITLVYTICKYKQPIKEPTSKINTILKNEYYIPYLYSNIFVKLYKKIAEFLYEIIDQKILDKFYEKLAFSVFNFGIVLRKLNTSNLSIMIYFVIVGFLLLLLTNFIRILL
ncbi:MAG: NADH-ubiquinone oxidoreductase chain L (EC [uncultured Campylobacterales bacterium]|uniref:NADH-ubiquinone oxidoreductase chain 5 n=1 Tax=uncultured Campylobacterales bacterium TaxID=352960 RepID=A0A6S6S762_9BACT|nr:MAG: NADH-ubiquinone oxidoreductase chain L (EC [uncultured Campylobacterales bacterium]